MARPRINRPVVVKKPKFTITKQYKGQGGIVEEVITEGTKTYYKVKMNSGATITFEESELEGH
ncbi:hypothetical protein SEA_SHAM_150 [Streptomyces phage Sham]|nr:hypothetical protein SEA_SHAM_150 [Streptomyces phage Sham]